MYKVGDIVLCIKEPDVPEFVGTFWVVSQVREKLIDVYPLSNVRYLLEEYFIFRLDEVVLATPLMRELV